jgi:hypothetical protein
MGNIMLNLGYITPAQKEHVDFLDNLGQVLGKNNPDWKKPVYGHIANGDETQNIIAEYERQKAAGKKFDASVEDGIKRFESQDADAKYKLGIKGEVPGADLERAGGPIKNSLAVQPDLRTELKQSNADHPDGLTADDVGALIRKIADGKQLKYPGQQAEEHAERNPTYKDFCEHLLHSSTSSPDGHGMQIAEGLREPEPQHLPQKSIS